jgi:hypothetical protein
MCVKIDLQLGITCTPQLTTDDSILLRHTIDFNHFHQLHDFGDTLVGALADYIRNCGHRSSDRMAGASVDTGVSMVHSDH